MANLPTTPEATTDAPTEVKREARFCPFCGQEGTLKDCGGAGYVEKGCWDGKHYCYEGDLPGKRCTACGGMFSLDVDEDDVHSDCPCRSGKCDEEEACEYYNAKKDAA
jgi:hypothetical protein